MASKDYKITVSGPGHNFEQSIDAVMASQIIALVMTGAVAPMHGGGTSGAQAAATVASTTAAKGAGDTKNISLAAYIKAKKGDSNQITRFLATASWLSGRDPVAPLTASAVAKALLDHHQKRLANPADALNKNVAKGHAEKRKDGSFFITPEGLEALDRPATK
jgi:hypothetical protein